jgi:hypothetical protein
VEIDLLEQSALGKCSGNEGRPELNTLSCPAFRESQVKTWKGVVGLRSWASQGPSVSTIWSCVP